MLSGGQIVAKTLKSQAVDTVFCVAGESYLPVLDALLDYPQIKVVTCRHESGAAFMAEAYANLTGKPGIVMATRGPGACNASIGIHTARQSSAPVIMLVGLVSTHDAGREAFQEFDLPQMFGSHTKHVAVIQNADSLAEDIANAFQLCRSGRPGPIVLGLPEDVLSARSAREAVPRSVPGLAPAAKDIESLRALLKSAKTPLVIVGGGGWSDVACKALTDFAAKAWLPVAASFRRQDIIDNNHDSYVGDIGFGPNPALIQYVRRADVILVLGARISEVLTQGYTLFGESQKIIHVYPDAAVFGKAVKPALGIEALPESVVAALGAVEGAQWQDWREEGRKLYLQCSDIQKVEAGWNGADMTEIFRQLRDLLPRDAIVTTDAGNFSGWCNRYLRFSRPGRQIAPLSGAMGYAVPSAVACAIAEPERIVLGVCGDGGFLMTGQEIATAMQQKVKPIIMVCNNGIYGTIRMHQERDFPGRPIATDLLNPDFVKLAESYGAFGVRVDHARDFESAWQGAVNANRAALIEIRMDPRQISTTAKV